MSKPKAKAAAAPARRPTTIRGALERARHLTSTTPEERSAQRQAAAAVLQAVHAIGPKMIRQLQAEGRLSRDGQTMLRQVAAGLGALNAHRAQQQAAQDATDRRVLEVAQKATDADVAELVLAARQGDPESAAALETMTGALWRVRAKDPAFVSGMVETHGPAGAAAVLRAHGVADLIPVAADTYVSAKAETWAKQMQDVAANDPTRVSQSDSPMAARLRDPAFQAAAARALLQAGIAWNENETPGLAATRYLRMIANEGGKPTKLGEKPLDDSEIAERLEEMTGGALDAYAWKGLLEQTRMDEHELQVRHRLAAADLEQRKARGLDKPQEMTKAAKDAESRRAALEKAKAAIGMKDAEDEGPRQVDSVMQATIAHARGDAWELTRHGREEAARVVARHDDEKERHSHSIRGALEKARGAMEGRASPAASSPAPESSTSSEPSTPATSGGSIRESMEAAHAALTGGSNDGGD